MAMLFVPVQLPDLTLEGRVRRATIHDDDTRVRIRDTGR